MIGEREGQGLSWWELVQSPSRMNGVNVQCSQYSLHSLTSCTSLFSLTSIDSCQFGVLFACLWPCDLVTAIEVNKLVNLLYQELMKMLGILIFHIQQPYLKCITCLSPITYIHSIIHRLSSSDLLSCCFLLGQLYP